MKRENRSHIILRYALVIGIIFLFAAWVVYHALDNTVLSADKWNDKAMEELSKVEKLPPVRGNILADDGSVLATSLRYYNVRIDFRSEQFQEGRYLLAVDSLADSLARHFPLRDREGWKARLMQPMAKARGERPRAFKLLGNVSEAQYRLLRTFPFLNIPNRNRNGLRRDPIMRRANPYGAMARRSIGGVGIDTLGEVHGISGLEKALDSLLYGKPGVTKKVPLTRNIVNWTDVPPVDGYDIRTTIDISLQDIVENSLNEVLTQCNAEWGVAVLMEVESGNIKAISNLEQAADGDYIEGMNRAVLGYEPGSVVKTLSMMIAVEDGIVSNVEAPIATGHAFAYAGGRPITDSHGCVAMRVREVIERSSNIGMAKIITSRYDKDPGAFYTRLRRLGFLEPMHTGIAGETIPRIDSVANNRGGRIALSRMCYGYSTEIPPLYTLSVYNAIANDGVYVRPRLVQELIGKDGVDSLLPRAYMGNGRACSPRTAELMRMMLTNVVWGEHGTGKLLRDDRVRIAGKTGTCYMIEHGRYNTSKKRLAFCGFFPAERPLYSCIVLTCNPRRNFFGAASTSGTVLKQIALKMYSRGMLDNSSDYLADADADGAATAPTVCVAPAASVKQLCRDLNIARARRPAAPADSAGSLPSVVGYSLRDALNRLERAGVEVSFAGTGHVASQYPPAGGPLLPGLNVHLTLDD